MNSFLVFWKAFFYLKYPKVLKYHKLDPLLYWIYFDILFAFLILSTDYIIGYVVDNTPFGAGDKMSDERKRLVKTNDLFFKK